MYIGFHLLLIPRDKGCYRQMLVKNGVVFPSCVCCEVLCRPQITHPCPHNLSSLPLPDQWLATAAAPSAAASLPPHCLTSLPHIQCVNLT